MMDLAFDRKHLWHPYSDITEPPSVWGVERASGVHLQLEDGRQLVDGMSSWWASIHGYDVPQLNQALQKQSQQMSHVMFGGLTHRPAIELGKQLLAINDAALQHVFFADSGSVAVEVAMKMAAQYCYAKGQHEKQQFMTFRQGYHGDTFGAMSVCDPVTGMHHLFSRLLKKHLFVSRPNCRFDQPWQADAISEFAQTLQQHHRQIIAVIIEPIVQGAGGMWFYNPQYLREIRKLCDHYGVLLIFDEIATGFGRTGKLFAYQHADVVPDILCLGKALTGGYLTLSAVLSQAKIALGMQQHFMHGPTFMGNPLACKVATASIELLLSSDWQNRVQNIERQLHRQLRPCANLPAVQSVRALGAIGVVEMKQNVVIESYMQHFVQAGVWIRPFANLIYIMPPYIIEPSDLSLLCSSIYQAIESIEKP